jgi:glycosyltransferase involved in cell wall biosynthesis
MVGYSIVVPVYNEQGNAKALAEEIHAVMRKLKDSYEIIFIDDGSKDKTAEELQAVKGVTVIRFRRNFGQSAALMAGIDHAKGDIIITMDGDRQNDPRDIRSLLAKLDEGYDVVSGWRYNRRDRFGKRLFSRFANWLRHFVIHDHLHDAGCSLKAYRKECFEDFELYGELHRYIAELLQLQGFRVGEVKVNHRSRKAGKTKYGTKRLIKGFLDLFLVWFWQKYAGRPLHLFGGFGVLLGVIGIIFGGWAIVLKVLYATDLSDTLLPTVAVFFVLAGIQLFVAGIMTDLLIRNNNRGRKRYAVKEVIRT